jgi:DNA (cytosine-5)-methyltransferase 1
MSNTHKFPYEWHLKDGYPAKGIKKHGLKVFSCFACGGGSTMGYKLAGFDVLGCNEIDPKMIEAYKANHNPKYSYLEPIQEFKLREDLPEELYNLDILDGSPPCSSFSMAGNREKDWGKEKKFREGQAKQVLDTLFFDFIDLAKKLQPKVIIAENVKGLLQGKANLVVNDIRKAFNDAGYIVQDWVLNAKNMGVPQNRERVFFIAMRKDLAGPFLHQKDLFSKVPKLELDFKEKEIVFFKILDINAEKDTLSKNYTKLMRELRPGEKDLRHATKRLIGKENNFGNKILYYDKVCYCVIANDKDIVFSENRFKTAKEFIRAGSFPVDYNFLKLKPNYLIGMSVPPVMTAQIAHQIYIQWLSKLNP